MTGVVNRSLIHSLGALYYSRKTLENLAFKTVELCNVEGYSRHSYSRLSCGCRWTHGNSFENGNDSWTERTTRSGKSFWFDCLWRKFVSLSRRLNLMKIKSRSLNYLSFHSVIQKLRNMRFWLFWISCDVQAHDHENSHDSQKYHAKGRIFV